MDFIVPLWYSKGMESESSRTGENPHCFFPFHALSVFPHYLWQSLQAASFTGVESLPNLPRFSLPRRCSLARRGTLSSFVMFRDLCRGVDNRGRGMVPGSIKGCGDFNQRMQPVNGWGAQRGIAAGGNQSPIPLYCCKRFLLSSKRVAQKPDPLVRAAPLRC